MANATEPHVVGGGYPSDLRHHDLKLEDDHRTSAQQHNDVHIQLCKV